MIDEKININKAKAINSFVFLIALLIFIFSPQFIFSQKKSPLIKEWELTAIVDSNGTRYLQDSNSDRLLLSGKRYNNSFAMYQETLYAYGHWELKNNLLILFYDKKPVALNVDSSVYKIINDEPVLVCFHKGDEVYKIKNDAIISNDAVKRELRIIKCNSDSLIFSDGCQIFSYAARDKRVAKLMYQNAKVGVAGFNVISFLRGLLGLIILLLIAYLFSSNRKAISWKLVFIGLAIQILLAIGILEVPFIQTIFEVVGKLFVKVLDFSRAGSIFLFGDLMKTNTFGFIFAFQILPTIVFFSALTSVFFYLGIIQKVVFALAWLLAKAMKISGAESLSVTGNIFLGQTEAPLMIKAYLDKMNRSEILLVMIGGMATLAGGVLAAYISFLGGDDPVQRLVFAKHLLAASVMAAPGAVVVSKMLLPQTENVDKKIEITKDEIGTNFLEAIANGTTQGLKLAANVAAMLLVFVAFIAMGNYILLKIGDWTSLNGLIVDITHGQYKELSLQFILGYTFAPLMWLIGICNEDIIMVGRLLGEKIVMSEFIAYISLSDLKDSGAFLQQKSIIMATYMLCGFANFASIGIQIGGIGSLAPNQKKLLSEFGIRALIGGSIASLLSATIVGMILG